MTIYESIYSNMRIVINDDGWACIEQDDCTITLGRYPNARWKIIEDALKIVKEEKTK